MVYLCEAYQGAASRCRPALRELRYAAAKRRAYCHFLPLRSISGCSVTLPPRAPVTLLFLSPQTPLFFFFKEEKDKAKTEEKEKKQEKEKRYNARRARQNCRLWGRFFVVLQKNLHSHLKNRGFPCYNISRAA